MKKQVAPRSEGTVPGTYEVTFSVNDVAMSPDALAKQFVRRPGHHEAIRFCQEADERAKKLGKAPQERARVLELANLVDFLQGVRAKQIRQIEEITKEHENLKAERDKLQSRCSNLQARFEGALSTGLQEIVGAFARGLKG